MKILSTVTNAAFLRLWGSG